MDEHGGGCVLYYIYMTGAVINTFRHTPCIVGEGHARPETRANRVFLKLNIDKTAVF